IACARINQYASGVSGKRMTVVARIAAATNAGIVSSHQVDRSFGSMYDQIATSANTLHQRTIQRRLGGDMGRRAAVTSPDTEHPVPARPYLDSPAVIRMRRVAMVRDHRNRIANAR